MFDYSFFALMFALATSLAPDGAREVALQNTRYPEQELAWVREGDGRWAMTINGRDMGHFRREGDAIVHETGVRAPDRFELASLADGRDLRRGARRVRLRGRWSRTVLEVSEETGGPLVRDPTREVLAVPLRLRAR
ncbi:MAG: hypothetical protein M5U28_35830 [Sandaracinaceae bacterium]|nr:hypothetical protein [Sandaracinaceae bacterium]